MIHKACMPVYMNSGKIVADGRTDGWTGKSKVLQEVADLKISDFGYSLLLWYLWVGNLALEYRPNFSSKVSFLIQLQ